MPGDSGTLGWQVTVRISQSLTKKIGNSIFSMQAKIDEAYSFEGHTTSARLKVHFLKSGA